MTTTPFDETATGRTWSQRLSPRELEVLHLVALGRNNAEIAAELFISVSTVKTHVMQLLRKADARDRVQLVVAAYTSGTVTVPAAKAPAGRARCTARVRRPHWR